MQVLTVHQPFGDHRRGDMITDPKEMEAVLKDHAHRVTRTNVADDFFKAAGEAPAPAPKAKA